MSWVCNNKQEVGKKLSVCVLNILPKVSNPPSLSLLAINLAKMEIKIFQTVT